MNNATRKSLVGLVIICMIIVIFATLITGTSVAFAGGEINGRSIDKVVVENFFGKNIKQTEYLFNFDDSADYLYVQFENTGYAVYFKDTYELLEYSLSGRLPYNSGRERKYYGGPAASFTKSNGVFTNVLTKETLVLDAASAINASSQIRNSFLVESQAVRDLNSKQVDEIIDESLLTDGKDDKFSGNTASGDKPPLDDSDLIWINPDINTGAKYIPNFRYFLNSPHHGTNDTGTCGAVSAQLLLSYNNYYNDRRIIPNNFLFTGNDNPNEHPDPMFMERWILGSTGVAENEGYFATLVNRIPASASYTQVRNGIRNTLDGRSGVSYTSNSTVNLLGSVSSTGIINEINAGRPVSVLMQKSLGGTNHYVVAYGYQNYTYPNTHPNAGETYSGYITHFGWSDDWDPEYGLNTWVNSGWCRAYITLQINHTHTYNYIGGNNQEVRCGTCGHREYVYTFSTTATTATLTGVRTGINLTGTANIPELINGRTVTTIGESAFANQTQLSQITIPASVNCFEAGAFQGCVNLSCVNFFGAPTLKTIGDSAFSGCTSLSQMFIPSGVYSIGNAAFSGCTSLSQISIPSSVKKIGYEAFSPSTMLASYGGNRANIDLVVLAGTKNTYIANGWTGFNIVEMNASGPLKVTSGQLRGKVEIPSVFNNRTITEIGISGFANQSEITEIILPKTVASISKSAFANCYNLEYIFYYSLGGLASTPNHSTSYSNFYYSERSLNVELKAGHTYTLSFNYSNLTASTDISNVYTSLGVGENEFAVDLPVQRSFSSSSGTQVVVFTPTEAQLASSSKLWCRFIRTNTIQTASIDISNVKIERGVADINIDAFTGCEKLATLGLIYTLQSDNTYAVTGVPEGLEDFIFIKRTLFVPSVYNGKAVSRIAPSAFADIDKFKWAFIQSGISSIGNRAFQRCSSLEILNMSTTSVTDIEAYTFDTCGLLVDISLPESLCTIGEGAFIRTKVILTIPDSVTNIGNYAFAYGTRIGFGLPDSIVTIGSYAFAYSNTLLMFTYYGSSLTTIGAHAFDGTLIPTVAQIYPSITTIGAYAYYNSGFYSTFALPADSQLTKIGDYAFGNNNLTTIVIPSSITNIGAGAFSGNSSLTIYTERTSRPSTWNVNWNSSNRPVVWGCTLSSSKNYVVSFTKTASNPSNVNAANGITIPFRKDYNFDGWYTTSDFSGTKYMDLKTAPNAKLYAKWDSKSCVAEGTLITLADGSQVAVECLTGEELLLVWNLVTGTFDVAPILFIDSDPYTEYEIIHLYFSDGTEVKVISEHGFWNINLNKYVFLRNDGARYIGDWFNKQTDDGNGNMIWTTVQLVGIDIYMEYTTAWSPVTFGHLCYYVNGMLSMPGATEGLINIFEVDAVTMQYDAASFAADIAAYGLFTYEEFAEIIPIPEIIFEAFNGQYLKVSIGKGLIDMEGLVALVERYADFFAEDMSMPNTQDNSNHNGHHNGHGNGNNNGHHNGHGNGNKNGYHSKCR